MLSRLLFITTLLISSVCIAAPQTLMTKQTQANITPQKALQLLKAGNIRFSTDKSKLRSRDDLSYAKYTSKNGQHPFAVILSCIDSRSDPTLLFDQHIGDVFIARVAGNIATIDNIASIEYAVLVAGSKLVVVMGHTQCGAITAACMGKDVPGNIHHLTEQLEPAVEQYEEKNKHANCSSAKTIDGIAKQNVLDQINYIYQKSPNLAKYAKQDKIMIVGAMHNLSTGKVTFFNRYGKTI